MNGPQYADLELHPAPKRIQRKRTKGWRMPEGAVYVGRPSRWGNPYRLGDYAAIGDGERYPRATSFAVFYALPAGLHIERIRDAARTVRWYRAWLLAEQIDRPYYGIAPLRGRDLACWCGLCPVHADGRPFDVECPDCPPCHADVLLELANR